MDELRATTIKTVSLASRWRSFQNLGSPIDVSEFQKFAQVSCNYHLVTIFQYTDFCRMLLSYIISDIDKFASPVTILSHSITKAKHVYSIDVDDEVDDSNNFRGTLKALYQLYLERVPENQEISVEDAEQF